MVALPYNRKNLAEKNSIRIEVAADSMRVGKTTAVKVIAEGLRQSGERVTVSYEDWQNNPYLTKSYSDPAQNFLDSQKWFIKRKWEQITQGAGTPPRSVSYAGTRQIFIQDVSPEMDYCYAETNRRLGRMSQEHFDSYDKYYHSLDWSLAPAPNLLVYLTVSDDELIRRAMDSRREFEVVEPEYYLMMKKVNREWLAGVAKYPDYKLLTINTDELDFAHSSEAQAVLSEKVWDCLGMS